MHSLSITFSNKVQIVLAVAVATVFWVVMVHFDQVLFFSPILVFSIPSASQLPFALSTITAGLLGVVVSMNVYIFRNSSVKLGPSFISGSALSVVSSACAGCSSAGFFMASTFGLAGATATSIFAEYQAPLRIFSIGLLAWALYTANKRITKACVIKTRNNMEER